MSTRRSTQERLDEVQLKIQQLKEQEKDLKRKEAQEERKKRTKRLIEIGGAVESVLKHPIEKEDIPKLLDYLYDQERRGKYFSKAMGYTEQVQVVESANVSQQL